jgi:hypothetical protein
MAELSRAAENGWKNTGVAGVIGAGELYMLVIGAHPASGKMQDNRLKINILRI